jgi:hypothetical protein
MAVDEGPIAKAQVAAVEASRIRLAIGVLHFEDHAQGE